MIKPTLFLLSLTLSLNTSAALYDRGNGLIYDDVLDVTWMQDTNYAHTSGYTQSNSDTYGISYWGSMNHEQANIWVNQLVYTSGEHTYDDWRLPTANIGAIENYCNRTEVGLYNGSCDNGFNRIDSELSYMFYVNLQNSSYFNTEGGPIGPSSVNSSFSVNDYGATMSFTHTLGFSQQTFWFDNESSAWDGHAWRFYFREGSEIYQGYQGLETATHIPESVWVLRDGDVANYSTVVPVPASIWLFTSALVALIGFMRRR